MIWFTQPRRRGTVTAATTVVVLRDVWWTRLCDTAMEMGGCCMECYGVSKEVIAGLVGCGGKISVVEVRDNFPEIEFGDKGPYPDLDWNSS